MANVIQISGEYRVRENGTLEREIGDEDRDWTPIGHILDIVGETREDAETIDWLIHEWADSMVDRDAWSPARPM